MRTWLPPLVLSAVFLAGCGSEAADDDVVGASVEAGVGTGLEVVAAIYPLAWVAGQIAPDAEVELLNQGGQEAHDLDISPAQRAAIETADVVLYTGDIDYQPQVETAIASSGGQVVSAAEVAGADALLSASKDAHAHEGEQAHAEGEEAHAHEGEKAHAHEGEEPHAEGEKPHAEGEKPHAEESGVDPHLWFSPSIMAEVATATGAAFAAADPDNAQTYETNAADLREQMDALGADLKQTLGQDCRFDEAIVSHAAYGYLLEPFGKKQHAVTGVGAESDASAGELAEIVEEIRAEGFTHVLAEPVEGRAGAEAVVAESGVEMLEILPLDAVSAEQGELGLPDLVREQATAFATALGCE